MQYKNNLYFRKLVQLKYARLRNREFYTIFRKSNGYKELIQRLGGRLDINIFNIFNILKTTTSIFFIRQKILHGLVLLNGERIKSPNILLKPFDIISLKVSDFSHNMISYNGDQEFEVYLGYIVRKLFLLIRPSLLNEESRLKLCSDLSMILKDKRKNAVKGYFNKGFQFLSKTDYMDQGFFYNKDSIPSIKGLKSISSVISILNKWYRENIFKFYLGSSKKKLYFLNINEFSSIQDPFNFFNNGFNYNNFEFKINGDFLDIVFLGYAENNIVLNSNDKYSLHYLYR